MEKRDARKLSAQAQQELRMRAVKMVESGMTRLAVGAMLEVSSGQVVWVKRYKQGGYQALGSKQKEIERLNTQPLSYTILLVEQ